MNNFYDILELNIGCSLEDIKNSYRRLCKIYHPDKNPDNKDKFLEISKAYETLVDEDLRKEYDLDLICSPNCKPQKINIKNNIELTLDECYYGCVKKYRLFSGVYDVITDPSISGLIAHEAFGHGVEMDQTGIVVGRRQDLGDQDAV